MFPDIEVPSEGKGRISRERLDLEEARIRVEPPLHGGYLRASRTLTMGIGPKRTLSSSMPEPGLDLLCETLADPARDAFGYDSIAREMARTPRESTPPFVYAICGKWGIGKSSLLKFLVRRLPRPEDGAVIVYFNAWRSSIHKDILAKFVVSLVRQLEESEVVGSQLSRRSELKESLEVLAEASVEALSDLNIATRLFSGIFRLARNPADRGAILFSRLDDWRLAPQAEVQDHQTFPRKRLLLRAFPTRGATLFFGRCNEPDQRCQMR